MPLNDGQVTLVRRAIEIPAQLDLATDIVPFHAGETLGWKIQ
ncbi:MAG: hypothetical protein U5J78_03550 [Parasphingorhabdus sp.]|nr:hypothetical protein [Parasphingorhabdus sp.]